MKKTIKLLILGFLAVLVFLIFYSCGAKKKSYSKEKELLEIENSTDSLGIESLKQNKEIKKENSSSTIEKGLEIEYEGCEGDSLTIEKTEADGTKTQLSIKGKGKARLKSSEKTATIKESEVQSEKKEAASAVSFQKKSIKKINKENSAGEVKKDQYSFFSWWWILAVILAILSIYLNKRFSIVKRVKEFFNPRKKTQDES